MNADDKVNVLIVDDQPAKLLSYEVMLEELGHALVKASSAKEALEILLKTEIAVVLIDVCMPELDGFELAAMIRDHPRFQKTAIIFVSAIHLTETDHLRGYDVGAVDYVPVPVVAQVLRAKVRVFAELYRKTKQLEQLNSELESRVADRTAELEAAAAHQALLAREVDHRARNALAIVQSIVRLTRSDTMGGYTEAVDGRIQALAHAHELLSESRWQGAEMRRLVEEETAPYRNDDPAKISFSGPDVLLPPDRAQSIALALHELATNAAKYGALSVEPGRIAIDWKIETGDLILHWTESGGPPVRPPTKEGFGSQIINASMKQHSDGKATFAWHPLGLECTLSIPCDPSKPAPEAAPFNGARIPIAGEVSHQILLVEDEPLVAMLVEGFLEDLGFSVAGPISDLAGAMKAAQLQNYAAAVLDVNLRGQPIYPLAELLSKRSVPFVFVTGYTPADIDKRFAHVPILQKPLMRDTLERFLKCAISGAPFEAPSDAIEIEGQDRRIV